MIKVDHKIKIKNISNILNNKCPSFSGIISQECKGNLWVNNLEVPTIAIAESYAVGSFAFLGIYNTEGEFLKLKDFIETELFNELKRKGYPCFEFSVESENIREYIFEIFKDKSIQTEKEFSLRINTLPANNQDIPKEYKILKVDSLFWKMLSDGNYENENFLKNRLLESWYSFEEFENKSVAYCTVYDNKIVAVMVGTANFQNIIPIDIETEEEHRRKGLAYAMAVNFIAECFRNNYTPQWDCVESNLNSYNMAIKLGFKKVNVNTVYWFDL